MLVYREQNERESGEVGGVWCVCGECVSQSVCDGHVASLRLSVQPDSVKMIWKKATYVNITFTR